MSGRSYVQVFAADPALAAGGEPRDLAAGIATRIAERNRRDYVARLALHAREGREEEFVVIGTEALDPSTVAGAGLAETRRLTLDRLDHGQGPEGDLAIHPAPGRAPTTRCFVAVLPTRPERHAEAVALLAGEIAPTHAEEGLHRFILNEPETRDGIVVVEAWRDIADWRAHQDHDYYTHVTDRLPPLLRGDVEVLSLLPLPAGDPVRGSL